MADLILQGSVDMDIHIFYKVMFEIEAIKIY